MQEAVIKYVEAAKDDLASAKALIDAGRCYYVPFLCHQAIRNILRGYYLEILNRYPPLIDDLLAIADDTEAGYWLEEKGLREFVGSLTVYPEVTGNPVYRAKITETTKGEASRTMLTNAEKVVALIEKLIG